MSRAVINSAVRSIQASADALNNRAITLARALTPHQMIAEADRIETEIERLRSLVLLLRHDAQRETSVAATSGAAE